MVRKLGKHIIEGITIIITQKAKRTGFKILLVVNLHQNCKISVILSEIILRLLIENFYKCNELCAEVNPEILSLPTYIEHFVIKGWGVINWKHR